ncbi:hypothetical protein T492DRAFT_917972 [Pavlovales sp. CCMP2436]|nr:hypothetical protein T492DRAFT_917972 [Pavlovales sp. CCMP2436]
MGGFTRVGFAPLVLFLALCDYTSGYSGLLGVKVASVRTGSTVELGSELQAATASGQRVVCVFGTYPADFNAIEYAQRVKHYLPKLRERGVGKVFFVVNGQAEAATKLAELVDLDQSDVELLADPDGVAGRAFGVSRGWRPDDGELSPYIKLFGMLFGLGAWATLPAVLGGYIGNPFVAQPWIVDALSQGQRAGRWPNNALELDTSGAVVVNKFAELPLVGGWPRRPLELATLRLQNMMDISIKNWDALRPEDQHLKVLTQLGGCLILGAGGETILDYKDPGICAVLNFENALNKLDAAKA